MQLILKFELASFKTGTNIRIRFATRWSQVYGVHFHVPCFSFFSKITICKSLKFRSSRM